MPASPEKLPIPVRTIVQEDHAYLRLDAYLAEIVEDLSRSYAKKLIKERRVSVNGDVCTKPGRAVAPGEKVEAEIPPPADPVAAPESVNVPVVYEDNAVFVVDKPAGMVVHPAPGHPSSTMVQGLLHRSAEFRAARPGEDPLRPGVVHRLDQHTSGLLVVAKTPSAHESLSRQAREHTFGRRYLALVRGEFPEDTGRINANIGRSTRDRKRMAVTAIQGRDAVTRFEVLERFGVACLVALELETGRTHQIRVHLRFAGHPVLGDSVYGVSNFTKWDVSPDCRQILSQLDGQALHAEQLSFTHPESGERMTFRSELPQDFQDVLNALRREGSAKN